MKRKLPPQGPTSPRRSGRQKSAETREALLSAAIEVISEQGWSSVTTTMVADRAGLSRGALQHHFYSREELLLAVAEEVGRKLYEQFDLSDLSTKPLSARIDHLLQHYYSVYSSRLFQAFMSIMLDPTSAVADHVRRRNQRDQDHMQQTWQSIFADIDVPKSKLVGLRRMVMSAVRGYALREQITDGMFWNQDMQFLKDLLLLELGRR
jgi:AcrR family transcriptional regulator